MGCEDTSAAIGRYHYYHNETATIRVYSSLTGSRTKSLNSRVLLESTSTLRSSSPIFHQSPIGTWDIRDDVTLNGTPFSTQVLTLLSHYPLQRLLIRVGDAAASSGATGNAAVSDEQQLRQEERSRGPSGTSILASFTHSSESQHNDYELEELKIFYQNQYASLLRYLLDDTLFPPCGAPLDSLRVRKHGHSIIVRSHPFSSREEGHSTLETVDVQSFLAADGATFCNPGIQSFILSQGKPARVGWGSAANNRACHSSGSWGMFDSLFLPSGVALSELLLGYSRDSTPWIFESGENANKRNSVWIDLQITPECFASIDNYAEGDMCSLSVTRGVSYRVAMPSYGQTITTDENDKHQTLKFSLGDLLVGHHTLQHSLSSPKKEEPRAWYPCPMSDSSRVIMYLPKGYIAKYDDAFDSLITDHDTWHKGRMEFNILALKDRFIDLAAPWAILSDTDKSNITDPSPSLYGISRTVHRQSGISSSGTMVSVLRYSILQSGSNESSIVKIQSLDVLPGAILKPKMRSLRMILYQGGGAGGVRFVPPLTSDDRSCERLQQNETEALTIIDGAIYEMCGSVRITQLSLAQLQGHKLTLHPDGTILLERTVFMQTDSSLWMMVDFDEAYLPFQKIPADPNRGVEICPSEATFTPVLSLPLLETPYPPPSVTLYSPSLVILPPVPDMSMPFNVISLSCTLWAFVLGSLLNILVRRGTESVKRELTGEKKKRPIDKLREKLKEKIAKLRGAMSRIVERKEAGGSALKSDEGT